MKLDRLQAPDLHEISKINIPPIEKTNLDNGMPLWLINTGSQELVKVQISIPAGTVYQHRSLTAFFTNKILKEGSKNFSAAQIAERLDFYGAFLDTKITRDNAYINVFCLNKHLDKVLEIIADILIHPSMPEKELRIMLEQEKQNFAIQMQKVKSISQRKFNHYLFGDTHPYGSTAKLSDYDQIKIDSLKSFFQENYQVKNWHIFISGKVEDQTLSILNRHFGQLNRTNESAIKPIVFPEVKINNSHQFIEHKGAMQTSLRMGKLSLKRSHEDYFLLSLTQTILGGFFGSRLMQNIREDKGYTYGIHSMIVHYQHAAVFSISSEIGSEFANKALDEVYKELKRLRTELVLDDELNLVKNYMAGSLLKSLNGPFALGEMMRMLHEHNIDEDYFSKSILSIQSATAEDVLKTAQKHLNEDDMLSIMVGSK